MSTLQAESVTWRPDTEAPSAPGVYEVRDPGYPGERSFYRIWDGSNWLEGGYSWAVAENARLYGAPLRIVRGFHVRVEWRYPAAPATPALTPWFPASINPSRVGVYLMRPTEDEDERAPFYRGWNGRRWCPGSYSIDTAAEYLANAVINTRKPGSDLNWRGLASDPAAVA